MFVVACLFDPGSICACREGRGIMSTKCPGERAGGRFACVYVCRVQPPPHFSFHAQSRGPGAVAVLFCATLDLVCVPQKHGKFMTSVP